MKIRTRYHIIPAVQGTTQKEIKTAKGLYVLGCNMGAYEKVRDLQMRFLDSNNIISVEIQDIATDLFKETIKFSPIP